MPYVFREELGEGEEAASVVEQDIADAIAAERDNAISERDNLAKELDDAKAKFANAFLTSPQKIIKNNEQDVKKDAKIDSFDSLFRGRNTYNAN